MFQYKHLSFHIFLLFCIYWSLSLLFKFIGSFSFCSLKLLYYFYHTFSFKFIHIHSELIIDETQQCLLIYLASECYSLLVDTINSLNQMIFIKFLDVGRTVLEYWRVLISSLSRTLENWVLPDLDELQMISSWFLNISSNMS